MYEDKSLIGLRVERRRHLKSVCLQDVILVNQTDEKSSWSVLRHLGGKHFADDVSDAVLLWMRQQPKEFYAAGIGPLIKRWDKCINIGGDYVEK
ncbi:hypothetical protein AVEN_192121-1 [Araneus ventricosus]|uniref:Histone-lysine N-methyltransferase SETMAR n=1 Tax=Araneus ventricosus TaxID=182803 RepID=A0A4Y2B6L6_ARAVE|nr:hypothetical protein AVEN_192121-1 [Araneus ventricosus]